MVARIEPVCPVKLPNGVPVVKTPPLASSRLPTPMRFPLLIILSLSLSAFLYSIAAEMTSHELSTVSRSLNEDWQAAAILGWKMVELAIGWFGGLDDVDILCLATLSNAPYFYLLHSYYLVSFQTTSISFAIDVASTTLPFALLRNRAPAHSAVAPRSLVPNRNIIQDFPVRAFTALLAASIYAIVLFTASRSWLPTYLVVHFENLRSLESVHTVDLPRLLVTMFPLGWAAREFIFTPSTAIAPTSSVIHLQRSSMKPFNPVTATLSETFWYNMFFWRSWNLRTSTLAQRMTILVLYSATNIWIRTFATVGGVESRGAGGWAALWATSNLLAGLALGWVGNV